MPKMKVPDDELDLDAMEEAEYSDTDFPTYDGPQPPKNTILVGVVQKVWWTYTKDEDPMLKVLWVADGNTGKNAQYEGLTVWDNITLNPKGKFRWAPFIAVMGLTLRDIKNKMVVAAEDDNMGAPIEKIGTWEPDTDEAFCRIVTGREKYQNEWTTRIGKYMPYEDPEPDEDDEEEEQTKDNAEVEEVEPDEEEADGEEDEEDGEEDDEEDEPAPPPTRSRRAAAKPAATKPAAAKPATSRAAPARAPAGRATTGRQARTAAAPAKTAATKPAATRGRRSAAAATDDDPPF